MRCGSFQFFYVFMLAGRKSSQFERQMRIIYGRMIHNQLTLGSRATGGWLTGAVALSLLGQDAMSSDLVPTGITKA